MNKKQIKVKRICTKSLLLKKMVKQDLNIMKITKKGYKKQAQNSHGNLSKEERDQKRECGEHGRNKQKISSKKI